MRSRLMLIAGALGLGAFWRRGRRRSGGTPPEADPAAELRERLAQAKVTAEPASAHADVDDGSEPVQPVAAQALDPAPLDPASRRRSIHEVARDAIDELR
jgi:hypothetical protein